MSYSCRQVCCLGNIKLWNVLIKLKTVVAAKGVVWGRYRLTNFLRMQLYGNRQGCCLVKIIVD